MKKMLAVTCCLIVGVILVAGIGIACHSKSSSAPAADTPADNEIKPAEASAPNAGSEEKSDAAAEIEIPEFDLQNEKEWVSYYEDSELGTTKLFDAAAGMIREAKGVTGKISPFESAHFANWYLVAFEPVSDPGVEMLDGGISSNMAYLVDLSQKKVIERDDFNSISPLVKRVIEVAGQKTGSRRDMLIHGLATVVSALAMGVSSCYDNPGDQAHPKATLESAADSQYVLKYYIITGGQQYPVFKSCTFTITNDGMQFKLEQEGD